MPNEASLLGINLDTTDKNILSNINYLIDGPYIQELRDITLPMRGSSNQRIIDMKTVDFSEKI